MSKEELFEIAKIIDNDYNGKFATFSAKRSGSCWHLTTNVFDSASRIQIWEKNNKMSSIYRFGPDTYDWQDLQPETWGRIEKYLESLNQQNT